MENQDDQDKFDKIMQEIGLRLAAGVGDMLNEASFGTLTHLFEAIGGETQKISQITASIAGGFAMPQFAQQIGRITDPHLREVNSWLERMQNMVPIWRQQLREKLDWRGMPKPNPRFGFGAIFPQSPAEIDKLNYEMQILHIKPAFVDNHIDGVRLTDDQRWQLQRLTGNTFNARLLEMVQQPWWNDMPIPQRKEIMESLITAAKQQARAEFLALHPDIPFKAVEQKKEWLLHGTGPLKPLDLFDRQPWPPSK
jgi:hypothetical protein